MKLPALTRLLSAGYRVFFLLAGLFAVISMILWEAWLAVLAAGGLIGWQPFAMAPQMWHAHELVFGYGAAAIAGFLLTAAPNWTGTRAAPVSFFAAASGLWLAGRLAIWWSVGLPALLVAVVDLAFLPVVAAHILILLLKRPKPPQMMILAVIALLWSGNLVMHLGWAGLAGDPRQGARIGMLALAALIVILGGRVTPAFTRNALVQGGRTTGLPRNPKPLAIAAIAPAIAAPLALLAGLPPVGSAGLAGLAGLAALARLVFWRAGATLGQPILWTLHLSYGVNALGLVLVGAAGLGVGSEIAALHVLGIGGIGAMTLSVMSRAALGHSGRALVAPRAVALAYALVPLSALARFAGAAWPEMYFPGVLLAGALWIAVFALYTVALWPVFWGPRATGA
ncbi:NnrS family protein [Pseudoponticoccus marisrubri]|uniref:Short-chain dehydrogenase n=1 Tax=Pseudoponticoccus marisrubri TaxID=1685382 RepID=A0A0W7WK00_9RHOB|nr:NnrS family protein [Pseudoponticoccus marisrubri]KUF10940.1 short-chain dehydrogenase [Pseudoponticoccus marisrubri]